MIQVVFEQDPYNPVYKDELTKALQDVENIIKDLVENAQRKTYEGKEIASDMIKGYAQLNENITVTLDLIQNVTTASKEQSTGMIQINDAVNNLDQITQQNAQNASSANEIAQKTLVISNTIIEQADAKEFNGKDSIKS